MGLLKTSGHIYDPQNGVIQDYHEIRLRDIGPNSDGIVRNSAKGHNGSPPPFRPKTWKRLSIATFTNGCMGEKLRRSYRALPSTTMKSDLDHLSPLFVKKRTNYYKIFLKKSPV
jgi:hypothetical protein